MIRLPTHEWLTRFRARQLGDGAPTACAVVALLMGACIGSPLLVGTGIVAAAFALGRDVHRSPNRRTLPIVLPPITTAADVTHASHAVSGEQSELGILVEEMLAHGRYALLLRPQIVGNLNERQRERTHSALGDGMAIVPAGEVLLGDVHDALDDGRFTEDEVDRNRLERVTVEDFLLDRYPVTNRQFYQFVASGGYQQLSLWQPSILAAVLDFVDQTGAPGPRLWRDGHFPRGEEDFPVVGVCWHEAAAFARWVGKRLPTDAEWVKAACWPVPVATGVWQQRKFPWGNALERVRANLWGAGPGRTVPVDQYSEGISAGGIYQLVGNIWEWTMGDFGCDDLNGALLAEPGGSPVLKSLRGGAFDTYFESQATCQFRSGDHPLARKHNVGFRCALGVCDVLARGAAESGQDEHQSLDAEPQLAEVGP